jgi:hypothetical protein
MQNGRAQNLSSARLYHCRKPDKNRRSEMKKKQIKQKK